MGRRYFTIWSSPMETLHPGFLKSMESVLRHDPGSCFCFYSADLAADWFVDYWSKGYDVASVRLDVDAIISELGGIGERFLDDVRSVGAMNKVRR